MAVRSVSGLTSREGDDCFSVHGVPPEGARREVDSRTYQLLTGKLSQELNSNLASPNAAEAGERKNRKS
jgi:hypothetical protein